MLYGLDGFLHSSQVATVPLISSVNSRKHFFLYTASFQDFVDLFVVKGHHHTTHSENGIIGIKQFVGNASRLCILADTLVGGTV